MVAAGCWLEARLVDGWLVEGRMEDKWVVGVGMQMNRGEEAVPMGGSATHPSQH